MKFYIIIFTVDRVPLQKRILIRTLYNPLLIIYTPLITLLVPPQQGFLFAFFIYVDDGLNYHITKLNYEIE